MRFIDQIEFNNLSECEKWRYARDFQEGYSKLAERINNDDRFENLMKENAKLRARVENLKKVRLEAMRVSTLILLDNTADTKDLDRAIKDSEDTDDEVEL